MIVTDSCEPREEREWEEFRDAMELWCIDVAPIVFLRTPVVGECWGMVQLCVCVREREREREREEREREDTENDNNFLRT